MRLNTIKNKRALVSNGLRRTASIMTLAGGNLIMKCQITDKTPAPKKRRVQQDSSEDTGGGANTVLQNKSTGTKGY